LASTDAPILRKVAILPGGKIVSYFYGDVRSGGLGFASYKMASKWRILVLKLPPCYPGRNQEIIS
jgi:hypothetical protein